MTTHGRNYYIISVDTQTAIVFTYPIMDIHMNMYRNKGTYENFIAQGVGLSSISRTLNETGHAFLRRVYEFSADMVVQDYVAFEKYGDFTIVASIMLESEGIVIDQKVGKIINQLNPEATEAKKIESDFANMWTDAFDHAYEKATGADKPLSDEELPLRQFILEERTRDREHRHRIATQVPTNVQKVKSKAFTAAGLPFDHEYPSQMIEIEGGIAIDTAYSYVSSTFLNGLINYGKGHVAYLVCRYGIQIQEDGNRGHDPDYVPTVEQYVQHAQEAIDQPHFKAEGDDWIIIYETQNSYFFCWYDQDVSDSNIERWSKASCSEYLGINSLTEFEVDRMQAFVDQTLPGLHNFTHELGNQPPILIRAGGIRSGWISG